MDISALSSVSSARSSTALSQLAGNLDAFLTLLTTQLKNQDPLDPLDTEKFTSQLVEFASVEQSIETNRHLQALIGLQAAADRDGAVSMLGRTVIVETDKAAHAGAGAEWSYETPQGAAAVSLVIVDALGRPVAQLAGDRSAGTHALKWDGRQADGAVASNGVYRLIAKATDASGAGAPLVTRSVLQVTGVSFDLSGSLLETAIGAVALSSVKRVIGS